jgi:hypothetical protein
MVSRDWRYDGVEGPGWGGKILLEVPGRPEQPKINSEENLKMVKTSQVSSGKTLTP